jgi:tRNA pseudouridine38-40 synthase
MTRTLRCTVEYDGTAFAGFQRQPRQTTVQGVLEGALARVTNQPVTVVGAGRTDTGVHATGQVVHFQTPSALPLPTLQRAINACLPTAVAIRELAEAPADFHARYDARSREYRYVVENAPIASPLWRLRAHHEPAPLAVASMQEAAHALEGRHDFAAFGAPMEHSRRQADDRSGPVVSGSTCRTLFIARCWRRQRFVLFCFIADAFLRHMVRMLVGTLLRVGCGKLPGEALAALLRGDRSWPSGPAAPAHGLYLTHVRY